MPKNRHCHYHLKQVSKYDYLQKRRVVGGWFPKPECGRTYTNSSIYDSVWCPFVSPGVNLIVHTSWNEVWAAWTQCVMHNSKACAETPLRGNAWETLGSEVRGREACRKRGSRNEEAKS